MTQEVSVVVGLPHDAWKKLFKEAANEQGQGGQYTSVELVAARIIQDWAQRQS